MDTALSPDTLDAALSGLGDSQTHDTPGADYALGRPFGRAFAACTQDGRAAVLVPLGDVAAGAARRSAGLALVPAASVEFAFGERRWTQSAAALECADASLYQAFVVLAHDVVRRLPASPADVHWRDVASLVDEWQTLLSAKPRLSSESELGLWAELWFIAQAVSPTRLVEAWRGPDGENVDFVFDGYGVELKASKVRLTHSVSQSQVDQVGGDDRWHLLSCWVTIDPARGVSLPMLVDQLIRRVSDPALLLRRLADVGYSPVDAAGYTARYRLREPASWFAHDAVPRVRSVDPGVIQVRYTVQLDEQRAAGAQRASELWRHFAETVPPNPEEKPRST